MSEADLFKLKINRGSAPVVSASHQRARRWLIVAGVVAVAGIAWWLRDMSAPISVELATVSTAYPSQSYTLLNATGYVVAQRKAAVASKATGRLEWLGVREGTRVKQGEVIARLENRDVTATMQQAAAGIQVAQANLEQGRWNSATPSAISTVRAICWHKTLCRSRRTTPRWRVSKKPAPR